MPWKAAPPCVSNTISQGRLKNKQNKRTKIGGLYSIYLYLSLRIEFHLVIMQPVFGAYCGTKQFLLCYRHL